MALFRIYSAHGEITVSSSQATVCLSLDWKEISREEWFSLIEKIQRLFQRTNSLLGYTPAIPEDLHNSVFRIVDLFPELG